MKINKNFYNVLVPILGVLFVILRLTHSINKSTFWLIGFILATLGFISNQFCETVKKVEKPNTDFKEHFNPNNKTKYYVAGLVLFLGLFYLIIMIFGILGQ